MQTKTQVTGHQDLSAISDDELVRLRARVEVEMRKRRISFSVGAVGEGLAVEYFRSTSGLPNLQLAPPGTKNVDALSRHGDRYSIKTVCNGKKTGTVYPDSADPNKRLFEFLLVVHLSKDWGLLSIHQFTWEQFLTVRSWDKRMNAWYVGISARSLGAGTLVMASSPSKAGALSLELAQA